jgi:hypothetical protein
MADNTIMAKQLSLSDTLETCSGPARVMSLGYIDGNVSIGLAFLENGVTWDGTATLTVHPDSRFSVRQ